MNTSEYNIALCLPYTYEDHTLSRSACHDVRWKNWTPSSFQSKWFFIFWLVLDFGILSFCFNWCRKSYPVISYKNNEARLPLFFHLKVISKEQYIRNCSSLGGFSVCRVNFCQLSMIHFWLYFVRP